MHRKHGNVTTMGFIRSYTKKCSEVDLLKLSGIIQFIMEVIIKVPLHV